MGKFLADRWHDIVGLNSGQWLVLLLLALAIGTGLFYVFNWLYSQRFKAQSDLIDIQKRHLEVYAGKPPTGPTETPLQPAAQPILPADWSPFLLQAIDYLEQELESGQHGQQGANRTSADIGWLYDAWLLELYIRLYERLPVAQREQLLLEQTEWLAQREARAEAAVESHGGSLAPLEYNMKFIDITKERIAQLEGRLKPLEEPVTA
jgi:uncharacterized protein YecT (DUF1311 family)